MIKQEEENKYRCKECNKLFKAPEFVMKHITVKHGEGIQAKLDEVGHDWFGPGRLVVGLAKRMIGRVGKGGICGGVKEGVSSADFRGLGV